MNDDVADIIHRRRFELHGLGLIDSNRGVGTTLLAAVRLLISDATPKLMKYAVRHKLSFGRAYEEAVNRLPL